MINPLFSDINLNITASSVAWYGAIIATVGFIISAYNIIRDRARVKVWYSFDNEILDPSKKNINYLRVDVTNLGRRPVKITHVGAQMHGTTKKILFNASFHKTNEEKILTEQNPVAFYLTDQSGLERKSLWYVYAIEAKGKEYRAYPGEMERFKYWLSRPFVKIKYFKTKRLAQ